MKKMTYLFILVLMASSLFARSRWIIRTSAYEYMEIEPLFKTVSDSVLFYNDTSTYPWVVLKSENDTDQGGRFEYNLDTASPAAGDRIFITFYMSNDDGGTKTIYGEMIPTIANPTDGDESGAWELQLTNDGTLRSFIYATGVPAVGNAAITFNEAGIDIDYRFETDSADSALYIGGSDGLAYLEVGMRFLNSLVNIGSSDIPADTVHSSVVYNASALYLNSPNVYLNGTTKTWIYNPTFYNDLAFSATGWNIGTSAIPADSVFINIVNVDSIDANYLVANLATLDSVDFNYTDTDTLLANNIIETEDMLVLADGKSAGSKTWTNTGTDADTVVISSATASTLYFITFSSDPGTPGANWAEAKEDTLIVHTKAAVTGTPSYNWMRIEAN